MDDVSAAVELEASPEACRSEGGLDASGAPLAGEPSWHRANGPDEIDSVRELLVQYLDRLRA